MKLVIVMFVLSIASSVAPARVNGAWRFEFRRDNQQLYPDAPDPSVCRFKQDGGDLTGECGDETAGVMGKISGRHLMIRVESWSKATLSGEVSEDGATIDGTWRTPKSVGRFTATKQ